MLDDILTIDESEYLFTRTIFQNRDGKKSSIDTNNHHPKQEG